MFIRIGIRKTRNTDDSLGSGTKLLLPSLSLGFSTRGERDTIFTMLTVLSDPTNVYARTPQQTTGLASPRFESQLVPSKFKSQLTVLFKVTKNPSPSLPGMTSFTSPILFSNWVFWHLWLTHPPPACTWTPALMSAPTYALSRKVLSLTKPKDKIYKTKNDNIKKSFCNYTTQIRCKTFFIWTVEHNFFPKYWGIS